MKQKNTLPLIALLIVILGAGAYLFWPKGSTTVPENPPIPLATPVIMDTPSDKARTYTLAEVASQSATNSCWTAINGNVYDLTSVIDQHKGGRETILKLCGTDGTQAFTQKHGGEEKPQNWLESLKLGTLAQ